MSKGRAGADSSDLIRARSAAKAWSILPSRRSVKSRRFGAVIYKHHHDRLVEYRQLREGQLLRERDIRVLPIARQTKKMGGTAAQGAADASSTPGIYS